MYGWNMFIFHSSFLDIDKWQSDEGKQKGKIVHEDFKKLLDICGFNILEFQEQTMTMKVKPSDKQAKQRGEL